LTPEPPGWPQRALGVGGLAFPRQQASKPALIEEGSTAFMEVYSRAQRWRDVPRFDVDLMAYGDGYPCPRGAIEYPVFPFGNNRPMPNANAHYDLASRLVELRYGDSTSRDCETLYAITLHPWEGPVAVLCLGFCQAGVVRAVSCRPHRITNNTHF